MAEPLISRQYRATLFKYRKFKQRLDRRLKNNTLAELSLHHRNRLLRTIERLRRQLAVLQERLKYSSAAIAMGAALAISSPVLAQQPDPIGTEFLVNTSATAAGNPFVAMDSDGDYVVAWSSLQEGDLLGIYARRFNESGVPLGSEFKVNTYTTGQQQNPAVAINADGDFVVVWESVGQDGGGSGIYGQRYNAGGVAQGVEFLVNTHTANGQYFPSIAMDDDGDFIVAWYGQFQDGVDTGIYAQRFDALGAAQGAEFRVSALTGGLQQNLPSVAMDGDGDFVVAWQANLTDGDGGSIIARRYSSSGAAQGAEFLVNSYTTDDQVFPSVGIDADGDFVIVWQSDGQDDSYDGIYAQKYNAAGIAQGVEFRVSTSTANGQQEPSVAMRDDGGFVIAWKSPGDGDGYGIYAQRYDAGRVPQGQEFKVSTYTANNQASPSIAMDVDGNFAIAWSSAGQHAGLSGVYAQQYASQPPPTPVGSEFQVNTYTTGNQVEPAIAVDSDGDYIITWQSAAQDVSTTGIYAQRYNAEGVPQGVEFQVNTYTTGSQVQPTVAMNPDGNFVIAWSSNGQDGDNYGVYAKMYDATGVAQGSEFQVNVFTAGAQLQASIAMDAVGNFVVAWHSGGENWFRQYDAAGAAQGGQFLVNSTTGDTQDSPVVAMDADGDFVIAWVSLGQDGSSYGVYARLYDAELGGVSSELPVNTYTTGQQWEPSIAIDADGDFVVTWSSYGQDGNLEGVYAKRFNSAGVAQGNEFLVNNYTSGNQRYSAATMDEQGDFVIAWSSFQDGNLYGVYARRYNAEGVAQGVEFLVNTNVGGQQWFPAIAMNSRGDLFVTWHGLGSDGSGPGVYAQSFTVLPPPTPTGAEFQVNNYTTNSQYGAAVATTPNGDYVVTWGSISQDAGTMGVYAERFNASGVSQGAEFRVNTYTTSEQVFPAVAVNTNGDFVIAWSSFDQDESNNGVYAQRYNAAGAAQGVEFRVNTFTTSTQESPAIAMDADGNFVITWQGADQDGAGFGIYAQRYNAAGVVQGGEFRVNTYTLATQEQPKIAMDAEGNFAITWDSNGQDGNSFGVYAQRYDAAGAPQGSEFLVNTYTTGGQLYQAIAMDVNGDFVITWASSGQDGEAIGIYAQRFDATGVAQGGEFQVNTYTSDEQTRPAVAIDADGDFLISWSSYAQDGDGYGIYAQRFNAAGVAQGTEFRVNTYTTNYQNYPAAAMDADGDLVIAWLSDSQDGQSYGVFAQRFQSANPNLPPALETNAGLTLDEGVTATITNSNLNTTDPEQATDEIIYKVIQLPVNGVLSNNSVPLNLNDTFTQEDIDNSLIAYTHDGAETTTDDFDFTVSDGTNVLEETFSITVTPVSDAPVLQTNAGLTVSEGQAGTILAAALSTTDVDNTATDIIYEITSLPANGVVKKNGVTLALNQTFTQAQVNTSLVTYTHDGSETSIDSFNFTVTDANTTLSEATFNVTVNAVNDFPFTVTNTGVVIDEDEEVIISSGLLSTTDSDNPASSIVYQVTAIPAHGQLQKSGVGLILNGTFTQSDINSNLVSYDHDGGEAISDSFNFIVTDGATPLGEVAFLIAVNPVNDAPVLAVNEWATIAEGDESTISSALLSTTDVDNGASSIIYQVAALPSNGELQKNGVGLQLNDTFTQADINTLLISFDHDGSESTVDSFNVTVTDGIETFGPLSFFITITPVSDPPTPYVNGSLNLSEGSESYITDASLVTMDVDNAPGAIVYTVTSLPVHGQLKKNGVGIQLSDTFTQSDLNDIFVISYGHDGSEASTDSFNFTVSDGTTTLPENTYNITISNVNDALILSVNETLTVDEGATATISSTLLSATDVDNAPGTILYIVTMPPSTGDLQNDGVSIPVNATFTQADVNNGLITFTHNGSETTADSFSFIVNDGFVFLPAPTFSISIAPVSDAPVLSVNTGLTVDEAGESFINFFMLSTTDVDNDPSSRTYTLTELPLHGQVMKLGSPLSLSDTFTQQEINDSAITLLHDGSETTSDSFKFTVSDGTTALGETTFNIAINPVNDTPVLATNAGMSIDEGGELTISTDLLSASDEDSDAESIVYTVTQLPANGELRKFGVAAGVNTTFTQSELGGSAITFLHDGSEIAADSFKFTISDGATTVQEATFNISITPVNDSPIVSINAGMTAAEGSETAISSTNLSSTDGDNGAGEINYTVVVLPLHGELWRSGLVIALNDDFTQADLESGNVSFVQDGTETTSDAFNFRVTDGTATTSVQAFSITVTPTNDPLVIVDNAGLTLDEGATATIGFTLLRVGDTDDTAAELTYLVTVEPSNGSLLKNGVEVESGDTFTQQNVNDNAISYQHDGSETTGDSFTFNVSDGTTTITGLFPIIVNPIADEPELLVQTIEFAALSDKTDGDAAFTLTATASSALPVTFTIVSGPATISGSTLSITGPGPITVRASQAGDSSYDPAPDVDETFCANPRQATITVQDNDTATPKLVSSASTGNQWFKGNQPLDGQTNSILTATEQGIYKVQVTVDGCIGEMSSERALVVTGGIPNFSNEIVLSPNPSADFVTVDGLSGGVSETTVTDMSGRKQHLAIQQEGTKLVLDARGLSRGTYLIAITDGDNIHRLKFIKY